jgi:hypothetical protein
MPDDRVAIQRLGVDREHAAHAAHVDGDHGAGLAGRGLEAAADVRTAAERDHDRVGRERGGEHGGHLVLAARAHHAVGHPADVAGAVADQVAQALAPRVDDAVHRLRGEMGLADGRDEMF